MSPTGIMPVMVLVLLAFVAAWSIDRMWPRPSDAGRYQTIDGLRGWLGFFVFIHHACIWFFFLRTGQWDAPPSRLHTHLGESSVVVFFMITGFLFTGKLLKNRAASIDWLQLFVARVMRLTPLYLVAVALMLLIVAHMSDWQWVETSTRAFMQALKWLLFSIPGMPDINGLTNTSTILAGVTWSLRYEWLFYLALPLLALGLNARTDLRWVAAGTLGCALVLLLWQPQGIRLLPFASGMLASALTASPGFGRFARSRAGSLAVVALVTAAVAFSTTAFDLLPIGLLTLVFCLIVNGSDLFGALRSRAALMLGDLSYGLYLLHGLVLYVVFEMIIGRPAAAALSPLAHWALVTCLAPIVIGLAYLAFQCIESPCIRATPAILRRIRSRLPALARQVT